MDKIIKKSAPVIWMGLFLFMLVSPARAEEMTLLAVGDVLPHPSWQQLQVPAGRLFEGVMETFFWADVVIGNLETPLTDRADPTKTKPVSALESKKEFAFKADEPEVAQALKDAGFTVLTLANNHMLDYKEAGLVDTLDRLSSAGILTAGAGVNLAEASRPCTVDPKGMEVVVLAASDVVPNGYWAEAKKPGIASMKDDRAFLELIRKTRAEHPESLLVLCLHWGVEATFNPTARQRDLAHKFIDVGADLILGSHPHRVQGVEIYKGRPIFYSLGNFQFDSNKPGDESVIAKLVYKGDTHKPKKVSVKPVLIDGGGKPRVLKPGEPEYARILDGMRNMGKPLGTKLLGEYVVPLPPESAKGMDYSGT